MLCERVKVTPFACMVVRQSLYILTYNQYQAQDVDISACTYVDSSTARTQSGTVPP
jgi:hypothetical protein